LARASGRPPVPALSRAVSTDTLPWMKAAVIQARTWALVHPLRTRGLALEQPPGHPARSSLAPATTSASPATGGARTPATPATVLPPRCGWLPGQPTQLALSR
jgi:hypothetical protein